MQQTANHIESSHKRKRCYSSVYPTEDTPSLSIKKKMPKLSSNITHQAYFSINNEIKWPMNPGTSTTLNQIEENFKQMNLKDNPFNGLNTFFKEKDTEMSLFTPIEAKSKRLFDWSKHFEEDSDSARPASYAINYENDIFDIRRNVQLTDKIIANALESEKTLNRIFQFNPRLVPSARNGVILYRTMKEYQDKFKRDLMLLCHNSLNASFKEDRITQAGIK